MPRRTYSRRSGRRRPHTQGADLDRIAEELRARQYQRPTTQTTGEQRRRTKEARP
jgi:hypothetical protein